MYRSPVSDHEGSKLNLQSHGFIHSHTPPTHTSSTSDNSLWPFIDEIQLDQQPIQSPVLHVLRQFILIDITLRLQCVELRVEPRPDHRHQIRHRTDVVREQVTACGSSCQWLLVGWLSIIKSGVTYKIKLLRSFE